MSNDIKYHSLTELQKIISDTIRERFVEQLWIIAEVAEVKINYSGHCYLELIEKMEGKDEISARIRGIMWSRQARFILPYFQTTTGSQIEEGMKILIKATVENHKVYGLSLTISDIDPSYTLGELAMKRAQVLKRLEDEGISGMNRELRFPLFPQRIAVVSSESAAGFTDFRDQIINNSYGYLFKLTLFPAVMQGRDTSSSVTSSLNRIFDQIDKFDIVVIVRGGGSQADLSWFDDYDIAYTLTQFPIPVLTGIGHEKDLSVCDIVAYAHLKTPTAVADYIIEKTSVTESYLETISRRITDFSEKQIRDIYTLLEKHAGRIKPVTNLLLMSKREKLSGIIVRIPSFSRIVLLNHWNTISTRQKEIGSACKTILERGETRISDLKVKSVSLPLNEIKLKRERVRNIEKSINHLSPASVLKRGFSITTLKGKAVKDVNQLKSGDKVISIIQNGSFESEIFDIKE